ncbi:hypothetical protein [Trichormus variabilis]|uniref:hypothetical protein n=1 Tax=Anabaena variabilis TaxID=264691 RepID=UPI00168AE366|nr:hypothetical protein [Trichormus variabilis]
MCGNDIYIQQGFQPKRTQKSPYNGDGAKRQPQNPGMCNYATLTRWSKATSPKPAKLAVKERQPAIAQNRVTPKSIRATSISHWERSHSD